MVENQLNGGKPTNRYAALKNEKIYGIEIARGIREAYAPLFDSNEKVYLLDGTELKGLIAQVSGADTGTLTKIIGTFKALLNLADFKSDETLKSDTLKPEDKKTAEKSNNSNELEKPDSLPGLRPEFHYNFQIHLPSNSNEETYTNIFNALRKVFK